MTGVAGEGRQEPAVRIPITTDSDIVAARQEGRALVGRLVITSLRPGEERRDVKKGRFSERILGMTVLPGVEAR